MINQIRYITCLKTRESSDNILKIIKENGRVHYAILLDTQEDQSIYRVVRLSRAEEYSNESIRKEIEKRAKELELYQEGLVLRTAKSISDAQDAEKIIRETGMHVCLVEDDSETKIVIRIETKERYKRELEDLFDYYAVIEISMLSDVMNIAVKNEIKKHII